MEKIFIPPLEQEDYLPLHSHTHSSLRREWQTSTTIPFLILILILILNPERRNARPPHLSGISTLSPMTDHLPSPSEDRRVSPAHLQGQIDKAPSRQIQLSHLQCPLLLHLLVQ